MAMLGRSYLGEQIFSTIKLRKKIRNKVTVEHLEQLLRILSAKTELDFVTPLKQYTHSSSKKHVNTLAI
jgi:hypothetical protein